MSAFAITLNLFYYPEPSTCHSGYNERSGQSGFHWGTGSALTTAAIFKAKLGDIYLDGHSHIATGVDGVWRKESNDPLS